MMDIEELVRPNIRRLQPYSTARDEYMGGRGIFLDANESPFDTGYNRYPDPHQKALKDRLSEMKGIPPQNIFVGNGSDEAIDLAYRVFCEPRTDNVILVSPSYGMYGVAADVNDVGCRTVLLGNDFSLPSVSEILSVSDDRTKLLFLCSPNNPTGNAFEPEEIMALVRRFRGVVVLDEAYADFSEKGSLRREVLAQPNLIVLQTLSKAWGLAGLRLGLAFASERMIQLFSYVKYPYNVSSATQRLVAAALTRPVMADVKAILSERRRLSRALGRMKCVERVYPSDANFLLVRVDDADRLYSHLVSDGIIVRNRSGLPLCEGCLRMTVGLPEENDKLLQSMNAYEKGDIHRP